MIAEYQWQPAHHPAARSACHNRLTMVEPLRPGVSAKKARVCLFDFDGTISLIRSGWMEVMVPMMEIGRAHV